MQNEFIYLDEEGYENHLNAIENLKINLGRICERIGLLEHSYNNYEYQELKSLKKGLQNRIYEMQEKTKRIKIVSKIENDNKIDINDIVKYQLHFSPDDIEEFECELIADENDLDSGIEKISINSPIGRALYKSKVGDEVFYKNSIGKVKVTILEKRKQKQLLKQK